VNNANLSALQHTANLSQPITKSAKFDVKIVFILIFSFRDIHTCRFRIEYITFLIIDNRDSSRGYSDIVTRTSKCFFKLRTYFPHKNLSLFTKFGGPTINICGHGQMRMNFNPFLGVKMFVFEVRAKWINRRVYSSCPGH
jgi:hypothetical protein